MSEMNANAAEPYVEEVIAFEPLPPASSGSRRALVRWSDGVEGEACRWFDDEILVCEGDLVGKTRSAIGRLIFTRDCDYLQSDSPDAP
jgi:hypothetical protein